MTDTKLQWARYAAARLAYEDARDQANELEKVWREQEDLLVDAMLEAGVKNFQNDDGTKPTLTKNTSVKCNKDNYEDVRDWLVDTVGDDTDFVEETVNRFKVAGLVKKKLESGADEADFPEFLGLNTRPAVRVYGWNNLKK